MAGKKTKFKHGAGERTVRVAARITPQTMELIQKLYNDYPKSYASIADIIEAGTRKIYREGYKSSYDSAETFRKYQAEN